MHASHQRNLGFVRRPTQRNPRHAHLRTESANRCSSSARSTSGPSDDPAIITHHPPSWADRGRRRMPSELVALIERMALRRPPPRAAEVHGPRPRSPARRVAGAGVPGGAADHRRTGPGRGQIDASRPDGLSDWFEPVSRRESAHPNDPARRPGDVGVRYRRHDPAPRGRRRFTAAQVDRLCGHWLRAGFVCQARRSVAGIRGIQWRSPCNARSYMCRSRSCAGWRRHCQQPRLRQKPLETPRNPSK